MAAHMAATVLPLGLLIAGGMRLPSIRMPRAAPTLSAADFFSIAATKALPSVALLFEDGCDISHGCGCVIKAGTETVLVTSASVARMGTNASLEVALAADDFTVHRAAKVIGTFPTINLAFLKIDLADAERPSTLKFSDDDELSEGDFVIALGNPQRPRGGASLGASYLHLVPIIVSCLLPYTSCLLPSPASSLGPPLTSNYNEHFWHRAV